jgi:GNAT superfamily N-acetyltransferase
MEITNLKHCLPETIYPLLETYRQKPYSYVRGVSEAARLRLLRDQIEKSWHQEDTTILAAVDHDVVQGFVHMNRQDWDSQHFGLEMMRLNHIVVAPDAPPHIFSELAREAVRYAQTQNITSINARLPLDEIRQIQTLEQIGFQLMDVLVIYVIEIAEFLSTAAAPENCVIRDYRADDRDALVEIGRKAYTLDRFHADAHLPAEKSDALNALWIGNSCDGRVADHVVVGEIGGKPIGYNTCVDHGDHGGLLNKRIGGFLLSAVAPEARGHGCYAGIIRASLKWFQGRADAVYLGTQANNYPVQRALSGMGFKQSHASATMHNWLGD